MGFGDEDHDPIAGDGGIRLLGDAIRLTMVLIQLLLAVSLGGDVEMDDGYGLRKIGAVMRLLHMIPPQRSSPRRTGGSVGGP